MTINSKDKRRAQVYDSTKVKNWCVSRLNLIQMANKA